MKSALMMATAAVALLGLSGTGAMAMPTVIAEIGAGYDTSCDLDSTCSAAVAGGASFSGNLTGSPGSAVYDDPSLFIYNLTPYSFSNAQLSGHGYQGLNSGDLQTAPSFPLTIGANSVYQYSWPDTPGYASCGVFPHVLFSYDYDDDYGCSSSAQPGNVELIFSAHWNNPAYNGGMGIDVSTPIFSPTTNLTGTFFGFEGLDPGGYAESSWDAHSPSPGAYVANIVIGPPPSFVPEPSTMALFGAGLGMFSLIRRRRKQA